MGKDVSKLFFVFAVLLFGFSVPCVAQVATGAPPFGSFSGSPDVVDLANLNAHINIPIFSRAGRGTAFTYSLSYDTSTWYPVTTNGVNTWTPVVNWGWHIQTEPTTGYVSASIISSTTCPGTKSNPFGGSRVVSGNWKHHDRLGVSHPFSGTQVISSGTCGAGTTWITGAVSSDGSGYTLTSGPTRVVTSRTGKALVTPFNLSSGSGTFTDANGNQISVNTSGEFTDTLGTVALTVAGAAPSATTMTYTAPSGANASYTMNYAKYTVATNFGIAGVTEFGASVEYLVSSIVLPDGTGYVFNYEATPSVPSSGVCVPISGTFSSNCVTGRLASVQLPTLGTVSYMYSGGNNGILNDGTVATLTRTTPDGTWSYAHSESGTAWTTTITDPQSNQSVLNFQGIYETERQVYQGSTSGTLLKTVYTCYNGNTTISTCNSTAISLPITQRSVFQLLPGGLQARVDTFYSAYGLVTERDEYAYGTGAPGAIARKSLTTYATLSNNLENKPATITIEDGSGNVKSQTTYLYDQGTVTATTGTPQHVAVTGSRGNPTTISYSVQGSTSLSRSFTYYDTGGVNTTTDVNGGTTQTTYGSGTSCGNSFATSIKEPSGLTRSLAWNCTGGVLASLTDENGHITSSTYTSDSYFWRPNAVTDQASNSTSFEYTGQTSIESSFASGSSSSTDILASVDSLGRSRLTQVREAPTSSTYDTIETDYDSLGRPNRTTLPYGGTAGQTNPSAPGKITSYDALGRKTLLTDSGGRNITFTYNQNDAYRTIGPAPSGENSKRKQFEYDALRRLTSICEVTNVSGSGQCAQTSVATGYWTQYSYDPLNHITAVTLNAQSSGSRQSRSYTYDLLGRMTAESNPESGVTTYVYDADSTCGTSHGDLVKKVDAVGNTICFAYDSSHRPISVSYTGPYSANTPNRYLVYDTATVDGSVMTNAKTRLAEAYTATCSTCTKITDLGFSYTAAGRVSDVYELTPHSAGFYHVTAAYWPNGTFQQLSNLSGLPTIGYGLDGEGRLNSVSASSGQNPLLSTTYNYASKPTQINFGSSDSDSFTYDPNTNRVTQYAFNVNGQKVTGGPVWNSIHTLASLSIKDAFNSANNQSCSYTHDDETRIASANCGSLWSQSFLYDAFGNVSKSGTISFQPTYSYLTNRMTGLGGSTPTYDSNGNVTNDSLHSYTWDSNGRPVTIDGVGVTYDALGRMVEENKSGIFSEIVYSPSGAKLAIMSGQALQKGFVKLPGGSVAVYNSSGLAYYRHSDWLGSSRFASTPARTMYFDGSYAPFGEVYSQIGTSDLSFTGMNQDTAANVYDFPAREYTTEGRWSSPDPAGVSAVKLKDPQTWNKYAYLRNNPTSLIDPDGLCDFPTGQAGVCIGLYIPTPTVPGTNGVGLGDDRGPDGDGGSFRVQIQITYNPSSGIPNVVVTNGDSQVDIMGNVVGVQGQTAWVAPYTTNSDGSVTIDFNSSSLNGWSANVPGASLVGNAPSNPIDLSISLTINPDGTFSVNGGTYSGYPSLEVVGYQPGQDPTLVENIPAGDISQLGTNNTPIPPNDSTNPDNPNTNPIVDPEMGGGSGGFGSVDNGTDEDDGSDDVPHPEAPAEDV